MRRSDPRQLAFGFAENPQGDDAAHVPDASGTEAGPSLTPKTSSRKEKTPQPAVRHVGLLERVATRENLEEALAKVASNRGSPGIDGQSVREVVAAKGTILPQLSESLLSKGYQPGDIRRVWIPKPDGSQRGLGIPNVVDRVVQQAVHQILAPIYEPTFHDSSHGFRPGRGTQTAIDEAVGHLRDGRGIVVDIDLASFFDRVHHQRLLTRLGQRIADRDLLRLIGRMLRAKVVLPEGVRQSNETGVPQGGPLSPLLSNVVLDELDRELERRGHRFVRYADDCRVFVRSLRAGERTMKGLCRFIEGRLRLKVNEKKSAVECSRNRPFLGLTIRVTRSGRPVIRPSTRSIERVYGRLRELSPRNAGRSLDSVIDGLNRYLRGWMGYFRVCTPETSKLLRVIDAHIRRRLRAIVVKQRKRARGLYRFLVRRGVSRQTAKRAAYSRRGPWWQSNTSALQRALPNAFFEPRLLSLQTLWRTHRQRQPGPA